MDGKRSNRVWARVTAGSRSAANSRPAQTEGRRDTEPPGAEREERAGSESRAGSVRAVRGARMQHLERDLASQLKVARQQGAREGPAPQGAEDFVTFGDAARRAHAR